MFNTWMGKIRSVMGQANSKSCEDGTNVDRVYERHIGAGWQFLDTDIDGVGTTEEPQMTGMSGATSGDGPYNPSNDGVEIKSHPFLSNSGEFGEPTTGVNHGITTCETAERGAGESGADEGGAAIEPHVFLAGDGDLGEKKSDPKLNERSNKDKGKPACVAISAHSFLSTRLEGSGDAKTVDKKVLSSQTESGTEHPPVTTIKEHPIMSSEKTHRPEQPIMATEKAHPTDPADKPHPLKASDKSHPPDMADKLPINTAEKAEPLNISDKKEPMLDVGDSEKLEVECHGATTTAEIADQSTHTDVGATVKAETGDDVTEGTASKDKQAVNAKKSKDMKKQGKKVKVCKYIRMRQDCWYGDKCIFSHDVGSGRSKTRVGKKPSTAASTQEKPQDVAVPAPEIPKGPREGKEPSMAASAQEKPQDVAVPAPEIPKGPEGYLPYVVQMTAAQRQISAKDLFYQLGFLSGVPKVDMENAVIGQYKMAVIRQNFVWVREARYYAEILFSDSWIDENLRSLDQRSQRRNKKSKNIADKQNKVFEAPGGLCRDIRLKDNPELQIVHAEITPKTADCAVASANGPENVTKVDGNMEAGQECPLDEFVSDYTSDLIEKAVKLAISEGLSESAIMEVIDDVTTVTDTPRRKVKPTPVDTTRTPRKQPDQLAIGFNYHSDLVVKDSPKTVRGGIIPIDESKTPRERPEKLAVGFSYHSDKIVKESPKLPESDNSGTPRRRARDQLAIGFNYHSDLIVKDSPQVNANDNIQTDVKMCNGTADATPKKNISTEVVTPKSTKWPKIDTVAVGFSYTSGEIMKQSLHKMNGEAAMDVVCLSEEVKESEDRNVIEMTDESLPITNLPAGSVW